MGISFSGRKKGTKHRKKTKFTKRKLRKTLHSGGYAGFSVSYNDTLVEGQLLTKEQTAVKPIVQGLQPDQYLVMYDEDAMKPDYIHWITSGRTGDILPYEGPAPPPGTGIHRYTFAISTGRPPSAPTDRSGQDGPALLQQQVANAKATFTVDGQ